jgi:hypothetical protein
MPEPISFTALLGLTGLQLVWGFGTGFTTMCGVLIAWDFMNPVETEPKLAETDTYRDFWSRDWHNWWIKKAGSFSYPRPKDPSNPMVGSVSWYDGWSQHRTGPEVMGCLWAESDREKELCNKVAIDLCRLDPELAGLRTEELADRPDRSMFHRVKAGWLRARVNLLMHSRSHWPDWLHYLNPDATLLPYTWSPYTYEIDYLSHPRNRAAVDEVIHGGSIWGRLARLLRGLDGPINKLIGFFRSSGSDNDDIL